MTEERFDELLKEMREQNVPHEQAADARERVWQRLKDTGSAACAEFRPQFGDYLAERLSNSRRLLIDDHLGRCAECRKVLAGAEQERKVTPMPQLAASRWPAWTRWAAAAAVLLAAVYLGRDTIDSALAPSGPRATVVSVSGDVYRLPEGMLARGEAIEEGDVVRTAAGSRAVIELTDGSRVEINQRTELALRGAWSGTTIRIDRGDVIVEAAEQRRGYLRVATHDTVASVKGTIFGVSAGTAGSVVSVVAGAVAVAQPGKNQVLAAGQLATSSRALQRVSVRQAISWSEDAEKYYSLLAEFAAIEQELSEMPGPAARTEARLLAYLPAEAVVYFAIPNLNGTIRDAIYLVDRRARENPVLEEWWASEHGQELRSRLDRIQAITPLLGEEVVFVHAKALSAGQREIDVLMAHVQADREEDLRAAIEHIAAEDGEAYPYQIAGDLLVMAHSADDLAATMPRLGSGASSAFASEIRARYQRGVNWLAAIDVTALRAEALAEPESQLLGIQNMRRLFFEQSSGSNRDDMEATLSFEGSRVGISSWLAPPGSAGSAEYVSDQAIAVLSGSTRDPRQAFEELLSLAGPDSPFANEVRRFESEAGISLGNDIADSLGTDFTFAIEQASLNLSGWVAVCEVRNPGALDEAARRLVDAYNNHLEPENAKLRVTLAQETVNGRSWNLASIPGGPGALYWTYDRGYLVASMDRAVATRAIAVRDAGSPLVRSALFQERLPITASLHSSGFFWLNPNGVLSELASAVDSPALRRLAGSREPVLLMVNGEAEQIHAASRTRLTSLILDLMLVHVPVGNDNESQQSESATTL